MGIDNLIRRSHNGIPCGDIGSELKWVCERRDNFLKWGASRPNIRKVFQFEIELPYLMK